MYRLVPLIALITFLLPLTASAGDIKSYEARATSAQQQAATKKGQQYQQELHELLTPQVLGFMLKKCSITTGIAPTDFDAVASISVFRSIRNYQAKHPTALTRCVGKRLSAVCFPWISPDFKYSGYPIQLHVKAAYTKGVVIKEGERLDLNGTCPGF